MTPPDPRASARGVVGILRDWFGEREIGATTAGTPAARFTASQDRPRPRICAADSVGTANEALAWHASKGFSLAADPGGRLRTELAYAQFDHGLGRTSPSNTWPNSASADGHINEAPGQSPQLIERDYDGDIGGPTHISAVRLACYQAGRDNLPPDHGGGGRDDQDEERSGPVERGGVRRSSSATASTRTAIAAMR